MSLIFFGSSDFSIHALKACLDNGQEIALVITTPPQKKGRGLQESVTPVQEFSESNKIACIAPASLKDPEVFFKVQNLKPDLFVVSSYGKMIPTAWLKIPARYTLNVHPSLLPKYRGAAPIHWPIILGDEETGVSIAEVTPELDAGDLFYQTKVPIPLESNAETMTESLGKISADALKSLFQKLKKGELTRQPQNHALTNYARKLTKDDGRINWQRSAVQLHNQIRGLAPWPRAFFIWNGEPVQILQSSLGPSAAGTPGTLVSVTSHSIQIQTGKGILSLEKVKPSGRKEMSGGDFARGQRFAPGQLLPSDLQAPEFILSKSR